MAGKKIRQCPHCLKLHKGFNWREEEISLLSSPHLRHHSHKRWAFVENRSTLSTCFTAFGLAMDIWCCLKEQEDTMHPLLGSKDINCLSVLKWKDLHILPEVKPLFICWRLQPPDPPSFPNGICFHICACLKGCETELIIKINDLKLKPPQVTKAKVTQCCTDPETPVNKPRLITTHGNLVAQPQVITSLVQKSWRRRILRRWLTRSSPATFTTTCSVTRTDKSRRDFCWDSHPLHSGSAEETFNHPSPRLPN